MKTAILFAAAGFAAVQLSAADVDWSKLPPASTETGVTFDKDISPIFKVSCVRCHGAERPRAGLRLVSLEGVLKGTKDGPILTAGDSANSLIVKAVSQLDAKLAMPPKPRPRRNPAGGPMGTNAPATQPPGEAPGAAAPPPPPEGGPGGPPPGGPGAGGPPPRMMPKPLTVEQVGLIRAWIDQGAK